MSRITKKIGLNKWVLGLWVVNFELGYMKANVVLLFKIHMCGFNWLENDSCGWN